MIKVTKVEALEGFKLAVRFSDGTGGVLDCAADGGDARAAGRLRVTRRAIRADG